MIILLFLLLLETKKSVNRVNFMLSFCSISLMSGCTNAVKNRLQSVKTQCSAEGATESSVLLVDGLDCVVMSRSD